jgi:hypothetical protein
MHLRVPTDAEAWATLTFMIGKTFIQGVHQLVLESASWPCRTCKPLEAPLKAPLSRFSVQSIHGREHSGVAANDTISLRKPISYRAEPFII